MECGHCRNENPNSFRHCGTCGQPLSFTTCDHCGFQTPAPYLFCGGCGQALEAPRDSSQEERRFATVLFADVVGFTKLADGSDPEDTAKIVDGAFRQLSEVVTSHGGTIDKYIGDSMMAVFGVPQAHQDDAERAVAAAIAIQRADAGLGFAIGVNTGEVMLTALGGGAVTVMGDTVNVAARLEKAAKEGQVLVGPITHELTSERISYREHPPMTLKGKREPVAVFEALSLQAAPAHSETPQVGMVGRVEELDFLFSQWRRAISLKRLATVLVIGEAGIGKTRLADELIARIGDEAIVVRTSYPPYGGAGGVRVGGDLLTQLGPSSDDQTQRRIRSLLGDVDTTVTAIDSTEHRKDQVWAIRRLSEERCRNSPVLIVIEDVHMASTSIDFLTTIMAQLVDLPMMVVFTGRPEGRWLTSFPMASTVRIRSLSLEGSKRLAGLWQPGTEVDQALLVWAAGNPLFLRELLRFNAGKTGKITEGQQFPASLRTLLAARLDTFSPTERAVLQDFAVIGDTAWPDQLVALGGNTALEGISALTNTGVIRQRQDGTLRITEPLLREVAYETIPRTARAERHSTMAELSTNSDDKARHRTRAAELVPGDDDLRQLAADALAAAGIEALDRSRRGEGVSLLRRSVEYGHRDPKALLRLAGVLNDGDRAAAREILALLPTDSSDAYFAAEKILVTANSQIGEDTEKALADFDRAILAWDRLDNSLKKGWAHSNKAYALFVNHQDSEADQAISQALDLFRTLPEGAAGETAALLLRVQVNPTDQRVPSWLDRAYHRAVETKDRTREAAVLGAIQWHYYLSARLGGTGIGEKAIDAVESYLDLVTQLNWPDETLRALLLRANLARNNSDFITARRCVVAAREIGTEHNTEHELQRAVEDSLDPGRPFRSITITNRYSALARLITVERALMEGRFSELISQGLATPQLRGDIVAREAETLTNFESLALASGRVAIGDLDEARTLTEGIGSQDFPTVALCGEALKALISGNKALSGRVQSTMEDQDLQCKQSGFEASLAATLVELCMESFGQGSATITSSQLAQNLRAPGLSGPWNHTD